MTSELKIVLAQMNPLLGDITGNLRKIAQLATMARDTLKADVILFPELAITGYPPEDLLFRAECQERVNAALSNLTNNVTGIHIIVGHPQTIGSSRFNAASYIYNGKIQSHYHKQHLPNYSVFDEVRYFRTGNQPCIITINSIQFAILICEDLWQDGCLAQAKAAGADAIFCINASPFHQHKPIQRENMMRDRQLAEGALPILYVNMIGGQDELVFDGNSFVLNAQGECCARARSHQEDLLAVQIAFTTASSDSSVPPFQNKTPRNLTITGPIATHLSDCALIYETLVLGTRDYVHKNGYTAALVGVSGGIDSALTLAIAAKALGPDNIHAVLMPSRYTANESHTLAMELITRLGITQVSHLSIENSFETLLDTLAPEFSGLPVDITEENLQSRIRGVLLMALSNKLRQLVLTTGNKSEYAVGYATLYGDMVGAYAVIKDLTKTMVYKIVDFINSHEETAIISEALIQRPPTAELRENQCDQDSLPPYYLLDEIIHHYVECDKSIDEIIALGLDESTVKRIVKLISLNEYKRRQSAPGVRITQRAFGRDWRYPITSKFIE